MKKVCAGREQPGQGRFMNVGVVWDHWACNNCNSDVSRTVPGFSAGDDAAGHDHAH